MVAEDSAMAEKVTLVKKLKDFIIDAKSTGRNLQRFSSRVRGTVDEIVASNEHVLKLLERTANEVQVQKGSGRIQRVFNSLHPTKAIPPEVIVATREEIETLWYDMAGCMKTNLERLIFEAERNIRALNELEEQLNLISGIIFRESRRIDADEAEIVCRFLHFETDE